MESNLPKHNYQTNNIMKTKTSLLATAATIALLGASNGQTVIDITGSTAGRATVHPQILANLTGTVTTAWYRSDGQATSVGSADAVIYKGGSIGGTPVTVRTYWAGSASGVDFVSNQIQLDKLFISTGVTAANAQLTGTLAALQIGTSLAAASAETVSEFGFSDVKQAATPFQTNTLAEQTDMLVLPFRFLRTEFLTGVTNITSQMARTAYTAGGDTKKSLFTGVAADTESVFAVGRDNDSGTRIAALAETGIGVFKGLTQWNCLTTGSGATAAFSGSPFEVGNGGYASGGGVATILGASGGGINFIGYVGVSDAVSATNNGAVALNFNGVPFSIDNVKNGSYTYWSKYQAIRRITLTAPTSTLFANLKTALIGAPTAVNGSTIKLSEMTVDRLADGGDVIPN